MTALRIGVCGNGTVGGGTIEMLQSRAALLEARAGCPVVLTRVGARRDRDDCPVRDVPVERDLLAVARADDVDVVVECIGGTTLARELAELALNNGKAVVTANKALIAEHGNELIAMAEAAGLQIRYEAAVAGGIPVIKVLRESLAANVVTEVAGIINGTGNFILTEMSTKGRAFDDVLSEAQALGYAEADPTFDIDGTDAAHKLVILASLAFGIPLSIDAPMKQGIQEVAPEDLEYAASMGYRVKHLGIARRTEQGIEMRVHPTLIPGRKQIATVDGVLNAVMISGDAVGEVVLVGPGAGGAATASSVCADLVDVARNPAGSGPALGIAAVTLQAPAWVPAEEIASEWYVRVVATDQSGVVSDITQILASRDISIESIIEKPSALESEKVAVVLLTHVAPQSVMNAALNEITALEGVETDAALMRVEGFDR